MAYKTYQIKQKLWSFIPNYEVRDDIGNLRYNVKSNGFSLWKKLHFKDTEGGEIFIIEQKRWSFPAKFEVREGNTVVAEVHQRLAFFKYKVDFFIGADTDIEITGNIFRREFDFERNGQIIASVSKKRWSWGDSYGMSILEGEDQELMLASAVVIDLILYNNSKGRG